MTFETEYQLQEFRKIQKQYFDEEGTLWGGLSSFCKPMKSIAESMLKLINQLEKELGCQCSACTIKHDSDCAVHNEPAYPKGECNCSACQARLKGG